MGIRLATHAGDAWPKGKGHGQSSATGSGGQVRPDTTGSFSATVYAIREANRVLSELDVMLDQTVRHVAQLEALRLLAIQRRNELREALSGLSAAR